MIQNHNAREATGTARWNGVRITIDDIRRAVLNGGDVSLFAATYERALGGSPFPVVSNFDLPLRLPRPSILADTSRSATLKGSIPEKPRQSLGDAPKVCLATFILDSGLDMSIARIIDDFNPDVISLDCSPEELSVLALYTFSLPCAVGLSVELEIVSHGALVAGFDGRCYPAGMRESAVLESWLRQIPLIATGRPSAVGRVEPEDEELYAASRIREASALYANAEQPVRVLCFLDAARHEDIEDLAIALSDERPSSPYLPAASNSVWDDAVVIGHVAAGVGYTGETNGHKLFRAAFEREAEVMATGVLSDNDATMAAAEIAHRLRGRADVFHGPSVRGTVALKELIESLAGLHGGSRSRESVHKAALISLSSRLTTRDGVKATDAVSDVAKEVLYGVRFSNDDSDADRQLANGVPPEATPGKRTERTKKQRDLDSTKKGPFSVVTDEDQSVRLLETVRPLEEKGRQQYLSVKRAIMSLISDLETKLRSGEIGPEEFERRKAGLMGKLRELSGPAMRMSSSDMARTIVEMMDAQDKQWNSEVTFNRMHVYYHARETSESSRLGTFKDDYHALKWLVEDLQDQGMLRPADQTSGLLLTGVALDTLLKYLSTQHRRMSSGEKMLGLASVSPSRENSVIRRYRRGDRFHDFSVRHSLKAIARRQLAMSEVGQSDLRVYSRERRTPNSDIVLCVDTSGSMGFEGKLTCARLAAAGLVKAALHNGDRAGIVAFRDRGKTIVPLTRSNEALLLDGIAALSASGNTNIGDGIKAATDLLLQGPTRHRKQVIIITDGKASAVSQQAFSQLKPHGEHDLTEESALSETRRAAAAGIYVSIIYVAPLDQAVDLFVSNIATIGRGKIYRMSAFSDFNTMAVW